MSELFARGSYYVVAAMVWAWALACLRWVRSERWNLRDFFREERLVLAAAFAAVTVVFIAVPPEWRTLSDEANLLSVSRSMVMERTVFMTTMAKCYYDLFAPVFAVVPTRGLVFPYFLHFLHAFTGYRYQNAFYLNGLALLAYLFSMGAFVRRRLGTTAALAAILFILSNPVVPLFATSGGFDFFSAAFFFLAAWMLGCFMERPTTEAFLALNLTLVVFSHIRYESIALACTIHLLLVVYGFWKLDYFRERPLSYALMPLWLALLALQRYLTQGQYQNADGSPPGPPLQLRYVSPHFATFLKHQLDFSFSLPYAALLTGIAWAGFFCLAWAIFVRRTDRVGPAQRRWATIICACLAVNLSIYFATYLGDYTHPSSARIFILWTLASSCVPIGLGLVFPEIATPRRLLLTALATFCLYFPAASQDRFIKTLMLNRETRAYMRFIERQPQTNNLYIYERPVQIVATLRGAVDFPYANQNSQALLNELGRRLYHEIYAIQKVSLSENEVVPENRLGADYALQTLEETQTDSDLKLRISRVELPAR